MIRIVAIVFALFAVMAMCSSCLDSEPGELTVRTFQGGQPIDAMVMLFNEKGVQIQEHETEMQFCNIKDLKPGTYFVKLKDTNLTNPTMYKAVRKVHVKTGDAKVEDIDVDDASKNPADAPGAAPPAS